MRLVRFIFRNIIPIGILAGLVFLIFSASHPAPSSRIKGIGIDLLDSPPASQEVVDNQLNAIQFSGVQYVRVEVNWTSIETTQDGYDWSAGIPLDLFFTSAQARGLKSVAVITGFPTYLVDSGVSDQKTIEDRWKKFIQAAVDQFGDRVDYWQIGDQVNSSNAARSLANGDPEFYTKLLRDASRIIKRADANDQVWMGSLVSATADACAINPSTFLLDVNVNKGWNSIDVVTYEPRRGAANPESVSALAVNPSCSTSTGGDFPSLSAELQGIQDLLRQLGGKAFYLTGLGWSPDELAQLQNGRDIEIAALQSDLLARASMMAMGGNSLPLVFWRIDPLNQPDGLRSAANLDQVLENAKSLGQIQGQEGSVWEYRFQKSTRLILMAWRSIDGDSAQAVMLGNLPEGNLSAYPVDAASLDEAKALIIPVEKTGTIMIRLNERPILFTGKVGTWQKQVKAAVADQLDLWRIQIRDATLGKVNQGKTLMLQWMEDLLDQVKQNTIDWAKGKIQGILH